MLEIKEIDGVILKRKEWIKADLSSLPRVLRLAIETLDQYYIDKTLKITSHLPCPYCGSKETIFDGWKKWSDGRTALYRFAIWIYPVKNMRRRIEL